MSLPPGRVPAPDARSVRPGSTRPRPWETVVVSVLLAVPPVLLVGFWLFWWVQDRRVDALGDEQTVYDPHAFVLLGGSGLLLGLALLVGLALVPWTVRLVRRGGRAAWLPVALNAVDLLPLPVVVVGLFLSALASLGP